MNVKLMIELFGYLGSALVVVSMLMTSVIKLRIINLTGSIIFAIYALIIGSYPTALMNFFLVGINIWHLVRLNNTKQHYDLVETEPGDGYLEYLLSYHREDIAKFFPKFSSGQAGCDTAYIICCDSTAAGMTIAKKEAPGDLRLLLDYTTPVYRDCSVGNFLYGELKKKGIRTLSCSADTPEHGDYLKKMGFSENGNGMWTRKL